MKSVLQNMEYAPHELMTFFNTMDEVFFSVDIVNAKVIQISNGCEKLYGHKAPEFLANNKLWFELIHPEDKHIVDDEDEILERGGKVNKRYRIIRKDKAVRWVENKISPTFDETGKLIRIDGITWDITERKESEEKNKQDQERYRQIVEIAQEGIWTIDENSKTNFVNQKMADILGYKPEEMMGKEPFLFLEENEKENSIARIEKRRKGIKDNTDVKYITKTGDKVWANLSASPIFDPTGKYKGSLAMVTDITRRKMDEEAIKKSEANLRTTFDNTDSSYILISDELKIISFNALAQKYSLDQNGKDLEINKPISYYFTQQRWPFIMEILKKVAEGQNASYELSYTGTDGTVKWNNVRWLNVKNSDNRSCGFILANKDITEAKIAALERERITNDLIQHNKDLEQFTYIISHNLRAPVANIMGLSEMLKEHDLEPAARHEVTERISLSIQNIDSVIQDLNSILQTRELLNEKKQKVYFKELVDDIMISIYNKVISENVQFEGIFEEVDGLFTIPSYLYSIFYNLASNSIKYRKPDSAPVISIRSYKLKDKVELSFKDNGKGIDLDKNATQLFGLYKRFDTSTEGKGMGLFMVKTQVEALGGTIKVKSTLGEGTEFILHFDL